MPPKRKQAAQKAKDDSKKVKSDVSAAVERLLEKGASYCEELGIEMEKGGDALFQWLCASIIFSIGIAEQSTFRATKGLLTSGLTSPTSVKETDRREQIDAVNSQGNVQRGPSMSGRIESTADMVLEKYDGTLEKLREAAGRDPQKEMKLIREFKGVGETGVNIFCREAQLHWEELFPFADQRSLDTLAHHGIHCSSAQEVANLVDNDRAKFVRLLAQATKEDLRGGKKEGGANKTTPGAKAPQKEGTTMKETVQKHVDKREQAMQEEADAEDEDTKEKAAKKAEKAQAMVDALEAKLGKAGRETADQAEKEQTKDDALQAKAGEQEAAAKQDKH